MPFIEKSDYLVHPYFKNRHVNTIYPSVFRKVPNFSYTRERLLTSDGDFLDLDWCKIDSPQLVLVLHGLEASSESAYVKGVIKAFNEKGWDGVALNFRGCSGEPNWQYKSYHMGATADVKATLTHIEQRYNYQKIVVVGFSLGGNVALNMAAEWETQVPASVVAVIAFSVPCDIVAANTALSKWYNRIYLSRFLKSLNQKLQQKATQFPNHLQLNGQLPTTFKAFDDLYTAPAHGFKDAIDYWTRCSSKQRLAQIKVPTLLVNASDDTFLAKACYPYEIAKTSHYFHLETPKFGGHVGFVTKQEGLAFWAEQRAVAFASAV